MSLAQALRTVGVVSAFRVHGSEHLPVILEREGFATTRALEPRDGESTRDAASTMRASWIVADSYDFDSAYMTTLAGGDSSVLVIDDLANQHLPVDVVVNGALGAEQRSYDAAPHTRLLLGSEYALLRPGFSEEPARAPIGGRRSVLVTVGGSDPHNLSERLVRVALRGGAESIDVVVGPLFDISSRQFDGVMDSTRVNVHQTPEDIRSLMLAVKVALCGGGQTLYELAATATPALATRTAENQTASLAAFDAAGIARWVGDVADPSVDDRLVDALRQLLPDTEALLEMGARGRGAVDGRGASRVARCLAPTERLSRVSEDMDVR